MTKQEFHDAYQKVENPTKAVVAIALPTGATELIINSEQIESKVDYYMNAYDDEMQLKANAAVKIVGCLFA